MDHRTAAVVVVWECGERECVTGGGIPGDGRNRHPSAGATRAGDQRAMSHAKGRQHTEGRATKAKGQRSQRRGGARSNAGSIRDDTNTPQNHNHNVAPNRRRQERGQMKE